MITRRLFSAQSRGMQGTLLLCMCCAVCFVLGVVNLWSKRHGLRERKGTSCAAELLSPGFSAVSFGGDALDPPHGAQRNNGHLSWQLRRST